MRSRGFITRESKYRQLGYPNSVLMQSPCFLEQLFTSMNSKSVATLSSSYSLLILFPDLPVHCMSANSSTRLLMSSLGMESTFHALTHLQKARDSPLTAMLAMYPTSMLSKNSSTLARYLRFATGFICTCLLRRGTDLPPHPHRTILTPRFSASLPSNQRLPAPRLQTF